MRNKFVWFIFALFRVLLYYLIFFASQIAALFLCTIFHIDYNVFEGTVMLISSVIVIPLMILCVLMEKNIASYEKKIGVLSDVDWCSGKIVKLRKLTTDEVLYVIVIAFGLLGIVTLYFVFFNLIAEAFNSKTVETAISDYEQTMDRYSVVDQSVVPMWDHLFNYFNVVFLVPIAEELMFRGLLFGTMKRRLPFWGAALLSALIFGIGHWQPMQIGYALIAGFVLCVTYYYTDSLLGSIIVHGIFNLIGGALSSAPIDFPDSASVFNAILDGSATAEMCAIVPALVILFILIKRGRRVNAIDKEAAESVEET
ncbi:MAG: CPBP family intramembrane metalloprotease [Clostridia bacterium]|nr:CPBP family intramembrane metalloprotease [Clostridia bacterium]